MKLLSAIGSHAINAAIAVLFFLAVAKGWL